MLPDLREDVIYISPVIIDNEIPDILVTVSSFPDILVVGSADLGPQGPPGPPGEWTALTQAEYDALDPPDPDMLYVIVS